MSITEAPPEEEVDTSDLDTLDDKFHHAACPICYPVLREFDEYIAGLWEASDRAAQPAHTGEARAPSERLPQVLADEAVLDVWLDSGMSTVEKMKWVPMEQVTDPPNGMFMVYRDFWWIRDSAGRVAIWDERSPQANMDRRIADRFVDRIEGAVDVVQISLACVRLKIEDYQ